MLSDRFVRLPDVINITGLSRAAIYAKAAQGTFPHAYQIHTRTVAWSERELHESNRAGVKTSTRRETQNDTRSI